MIKQEGRRNEILVDKVETDDRGVEMIVTITCYLRRPEDADKGQLPLAGRNLG
jgi:hypothetical protein